MSSSSRSHLGPLRRFTVGSQYILSPLSRDWQGQNQCRYEAGMTKYRVDRILPVRWPINYRVDRGTMIMTC